MVCNDCIKKDVCKHKEYLDKYCGLILNDCTYKKSEGSSVKTVEPLTFPNISVTQLEEPKKQTLTREEVEEKILELSKPKDEPTLKEMKVCELCGCTDYAEYIHKCSQCGKLVCSNCSIELSDHSADTNSPMAVETICDDCWYNLEESDGEEDE